MGLNLADTSTFTIISQLIETNVGIFFFLMSMFCGDDQTIPKPLLNSIKIHTRNLFTFEIIKTPPNTKYGSIKILWIIVMVWL